jgi:hypothetical protein
MEGQTTQWPSERRVNGRTDNTTAIRKRLNERTDNTMAIRKKVNGRTDNTMAIRQNGKWKDRQYNGLRK